MFRINYLHRSQHINQIMEDIVYIILGTERMFESIENLTKFSVKWKKEHGLIQ